MRHIESNAPEMGGIENPGYVGFPHVVADDIRDFRTETECVETQASLERPLHDMQPVVGEYGAAQILVVTESLESYLGYIVFYTLILHLWRYFYTRVNIGGTRNRNQSAAPRLKPKISYFEVGNHIVSLSRSCQFTVSITYPPETKTRSKTTQAT